MLSPERNCPRRASRKQRHESGRPCLETRVDSDTRRRLPWFDGLDESGDDDASDGDDVTVDAASAAATDAPAEARAYSTRRQLMPLVGAVGEFRSGDLLVARREDELDT